MRKPLIVALALLVASALHALKLEVYKGATSVQIPIWVESSASPGFGLTGLVFNSGGLSCYYVQLTAAQTATLTAGAYSYNIRMTAPSVVTLLEGTIVVRATP